MTPEVYRVFEDICSEAAIQGAVLEVGAVPGPQGLLQMACLKNVVHRVGINLDRASFDEGCEIIQGDANEMTCFEDNQFQAVLCNATLEHDPYFWKTLAEIRRVTAPQGLIVIGVPGFSGMGLESFAPRASILGRLLRLVTRITKTSVLTAGAVTLGEHHFPGDYYRFTEMAMRHVFLSELTDVRVCKVMNPPRFIGCGRKP